MTRVVGQNNTESVLAILPDNVAFTNSRLNLIKTPIQITTITKSLNNFHYIHNLTIIQQQLEQLEEEEE